MDTNLSAVLYGKGDLRMEDLPVPEPKEGEVLINVQYAGLCVTDVHMIDAGTIGSLSIDKPMVIGHEFSGVVSKVGRGVINVKIGDRVAADPMGACGDCSQCKRGRLNTCLNRILFGLSPDAGGGLARFAVIPAVNAHKLPDNVDFEAGAMIEPLSVVVNAASKTGISLGDTVLVFGAGPIGLLALQVARAMGATTVCVIDLDSERLQLARELGASHTIQFTAGDTDAQKNAQKIVDTALSPGGNVVVIGFGPDDVTIPIAEAILREVSIKGAGGNNYNFPAAIKLVATGAVKLLPLVSDRFLLCSFPEVLDMARKRECIKIMIDCSKSK